jgi:hypothetical protein
MFNSNETRQYKHLDTITALFVAILLVSNIVSAKIINFGVFSFAGGIIVFPLSYIFGDILTEVYGYKRSRKVIWLGFSANLMMAAIFILVQKLPSAPFWHGQASYDQILGQTPRIVVASLLGYFAGEFSNSFVLAKMKIITKGKWLWSRTIGSTIIGELIDTIIFITIAFYGILPQNALITVILSNYIVKTLIEVVFTPITYGVVNWLKKEESEDYFDKKTNFNPFALK